MGSLIPSIQTPYGKLWRNATGDPVERLVPYLKKKKKSALRNDPFRIPVVTDMSLPKHTIEVMLFIRFFS